jgi:glycosyltransferase involved in cell wall biosynthesis
MRALKVLILSTYSKKGGASRAAQRLHECLLANDIHVKFLPIYMDKDRLSLRRLFRILWDRLPAMLAAREKNYFSSGALNNRKLVEHINSSDIDIIHINWIGAGAMSVEDIASLTKPIIWSLHDMWAFTGGCHYSGGCVKYQDFCGACPNLNSSHQNDLSSRLITKKMSAYKKVPQMVINTTSSWMRSCGKNSATLGKHQFIQLPNPINIDDFYPIPSTLARKTLGLESKKNLILFGALSGIEDKRKGYSQLVSALELLSGTLDIELVVYGENKPLTYDLPFKTHSVGSISTTKDLRLLFSAVNMSILPSLEENSALTIQESLACGTPVVAFNIGGNQDLIDHKRTGFLADRVTPEALAEGIKWLLDNQNLVPFHQNALQQVKQNFSYQALGPKYLTQYESIIKNYARTS